MLIRLVYVSKAVGLQTPALTHALLDKARAWNAQHHITGVLCEGQGMYLQVLEGERPVVNQLYGRIAADARHTGVELIHCESIRQRRYGLWSMAWVSMSDVDPQTTIAWPELDPYSASGMWVMSRIDALVADGQRIQPPAH